MAALVGLPILVAIVLNSIDAPAGVGPLLVVAAGFAWGVLGVRYVVHIARSYATTNAVALEEALGSVDSKRLVAEHPLMTVVPFLVTAGWITMLIGLVWLAFVDARVAIGTLVALVVIALIWNRRARTGAADVAP